MLRGYLGIIILNLLYSFDKKGLSGYELMKKIRTESGFWKPSPGSVYPLLRKCLENKLVNVKQEGKRKIYSLTALGKLKLREFSKRKDKLLLEANAFLDYLAKMKKGIR